MKIFLARKFAREAEKILSELDQDAALAEISAAQETAAEIIKQQKLILDTLALLKRRIIWPVKK